MSNYTKTTNFTAKDALTTGDPNKVIKGSEHDTEYDAIATASATKANKIVSGVTNNVIKQDSGGDLVDSGYSFSGLVGDTAITKAEIDRIIGVTSAVQAQLDAKADKGANSDITSLSGLTTDLSVAQGGTGQSTEQAAIDALTQVSAATNEHVFTKDTATGNAVWKSAATQKHEIFTASGTFTTPVGVTSVSVLLIGGGGGGGATSGGNSANSCGGGGGGSAGDSFIAKLTVSASTGYSITIGAGGASATDGGASSFAGLASASGGKKGANGSIPTRGAGGSNTTAAGGSGGSGATAGSSTNNGYDGGDGGNGASAPAGGGGGGAGGSGIGGIGGAGGAGGATNSASGTAGSAATHYGSGGGGAGGGGSDSGTAGAAGGAGADGLVLIWWE